MAHQSLFLSAATFAEKKHSGQERKASVVVGVPYLCHLLQVAGLVMEAGGDEEMAAAAILHDVLEDTDATEADLRAFLPSRVVDMVLECTEAGMLEKPMTSWLDRKKAYLGHLACATEGALCICLADKLHNLRALLMQYRYIEDRAFEKLVKEEKTLAGRRSQTLWFHHQISLVGRNRLNEIIGDDPKTPFQTGIQSLIDETTMLIDQFYQ